MSDRPQSLPPLPSSAVRGWIAAGFALLALLVYGRSLGNDFIRTDDGLLIFENPIIQEITPRTLKAAFTTYDPELYIPLTFLSYQMDHALGGLDATAYHAQNLLWHTLNALLVLWLAYLLLRHRLAALTVGLLFLVHPLNTEAVAWAAARKDVLSTFFFLAAWISYLSYRAAEPNRSRRRYVLSLTLFLLGLLAKVMVLTLPLVLLLTDELQRRSRDRRMLLDKLPYLFFSVIFGIVALYGKQELLVQVSPWQAALLAVKSIIFYIQKLLWPADFSILYAYTKPITLASPDFFLPLLLVIVALALAAWAYNRVRLLAFGILFYLLTLVPTFTNLIKGEPFVGSDRYAYVPMVGIVLMVSAGIWAWADGRRQREIPVLCAVGMAVLALSVLAYRQSLVWASAETIYRHVLTVDPDSYSARNNLANAYRRQGRLEEAEAELHQALQIKDLPRIRLNLGALYTRLERFEEAHRYLTGATLSSAQGAEAYAALGNLYVAEGKFAEALAAYDRAIEIRPDYALAYVNRGSLHRRQRDVDPAQAEADFRKAIEIEPRMGQAWFNLGVLLEAQGKTDQALQAYLRAADVQPWDAPTRTNLGILYAAMGDRAQAREQFEELLRYQPGNETALQALEQLGR